MVPPLLRRPIGRFGLVLALTLIGGSAGLVYGVEAPPTFTARAYVVATGGSAGSTGGSATLAGARPDAVAYAHAYGRIATSGPVLAQAASVLGTDTSGLDDVKASTFSDAPVIEVAASARSATRAQYLANAVAHALAGYGSDDESELNLTVLAPATAPARPSSPDPPCELVIGTSAGMLTGALAALVSLLSSRRPRRPRFVGPVEIDGHLGIWRARSSTPS
jgi:capsular polysaccharide biosynthesis protein